MRHALRAQCRAVLIVLGAPGRAWQVHIKASMALDELEREQVPSV
jgi:hypothetical protein